MNTLPSEIQDIIYIYYWKNKYEKVIQELERCSILERKIKKFLHTYCFRDNLFKKEYLYYLISFNNEIKNVIKNKNLKYLCNMNDLTLYYCFNDKYKIDICSSVHENLKYIAIFSICCSGQMRYFVLNRFNELSKLNFNIYNV